MKMIKLGRSLKIWNKNKTFRSKTYSTQFANRTLLTANRAFTLIELLISLVLVGLIGIALTRFLNIGMSIYSDSRIRSALMSDTRISLDRMSRELRQAYTLTTPAIGGASDSIVFTADLDNDGGYETITYRLNLSDDSILERNDDEESTNYYTITSNVNSFNVERGSDDDSNLLTITLTLEKSDISVTLSSKVKARNL